MEDIGGYTFIKKVGALTDDGVAVYDLAARRFLYANKNFLNIFGLKEGDLFLDASIIIKIVLAEDTAYLVSRFNELLKTGCINTTEFRLQLGENDLRHVSCDVLTLDNTNLVTAFVKDISMARRHEDYLIKYTAQKDTMLDMLTHNLSGPLQLSKDLLSSILRGYSENNMADLSRLISIMQENTQQCIDIVNDFLREEHSESSRTYVRKTRFDVIEKINVTLDKLRELNKDKLFTITTEIKNLNINSDVVKFFQIIHNVLSNAIKFTPDQGIIDIRITEESSHYLIRIGDNGIGIPQNLHPTIFQEKVTGRTGLKGEKSTGLGLSIAGRLVTVMGGEIWFDSSEGKGASFYIRLPKE
jgi:two-component system, OmpR family, sensor histidine kinase VicK